MAKKKHQVHHHLPKSANVVIIVLAVVIGIAGVNLLFSGGIGGLIGQATGAVQAGDAWGALVDDPRGQCPGDCYPAGAMYCVEPPEGVTGMCGDSHPADNSLSDCFCPGAAGPLGDQGPPGSAGDDGVGGGDDDDDDDDEQCIDNSDCSHLTNEATCTQGRCNSAGECFSNTCTVEQECVQIANEYTCQDPPECRTASDCIIDQQAQDENRRDWCQETICLEGVCEANFFCQNTGLTCDGNGGCCGLTTHGDNIPCPCDTNDECGYLNNPDECSIGVCATTCQQMRDPNCGAAGPLGEQGETGGGGGGGGDPGEEASTGGDCGSALACRVGHSCSFSGQPGLCDAGVNSEGNTISCFCRTGGFE